jgi:hypothetical protein
MHRIDIADARGGLTAVAATGHKAVAFPMNFLGTFSRTVRWQHSC